MNSLHRNAQLSLRVFTAKHLLYVSDKLLQFSPHFSKTLAFCFLSFLPCCLGSHNNNNNNKIASILEFYECLLSFMLSHGCAGQKYTDTVIASVAS